MPQKTDLNVNPYYDDFNANNQYYRILFKPSVPVQARELTQVQSGLQNQIESLAQLNLRNGDIVSGCTISDISYLPFVRLTDFQSNGMPYDVTKLVNTQVISSSTNLAARILTSTVGQESNYPNTNVVYVKFFNTGANASSNQVTSFVPGEQLTFYTIPRTGNTDADTIATVNVYSTNATTVATGNAHGISITDGIVFLSGCLVQVLNPTFGIVNATGIYASNLVVGFIANESIINANLDGSLVDNALGYENENAPGADRLKIEPGLIVLDPVVAANTEGFNPIATYNFGSLITTAVAGSNLYSIVGSAIAQRVSDSDGNYVVNPFVVDTITSLPGNAIITAITSNNFLGRISPGIGYAQGSRIELQKTTYLNMRRGIDTQSFDNQQVTFDYGAYFTLSEVAGTFSFTNAASVSLYDRPQLAVTNRTFTSLAPVGTLIGNATMRCFSYSSGVPGSNSAQYFLHVYNMNLANNFNVNQIKSVYYNGTIKGVGDVISDGVVSASMDDQLYSFGQSGIKNIRDKANNNFSQYIYRTVNNATMIAGGNVVVTITSSAPGGTDLLPYGIGVLPDINASTFTLTIAANGATTNLTGSIASANQIVTGTSTIFLTDFNIGDQITASATTRTILNIANNTSLTVDAPWGSNLAANTYVKTFTAGKIISIAQNTLGKPSYVQIVNSTSFSIVTNQIPSASISCYVTYDVLRTNVLPAQKVINKNRMVKINIANNAGGPGGPWCLGLADIHRVRKIYGTAGGGYVTSGTDLTTSFAFDSGQKDTHYGPGWIYPKGAITSNQILVVCDYFSVNTAPGAGFFTVESYPIDDINKGSNTNAITTEGIPVYIDESGNKRFLRDHIDFRTTMINTAVDTGYVDLANSAAVTAAIALATTNPPANVTFNVPGAGLNTPSFSKNFQGSLTIYLPRNDLIMMTPDNIINIKEGVSSIHPQSPLWPDNVMVMAIVNIPAYPSLTTDQLDALLAINQSSRTLIRDTSSAISSSLMTNRRYTMRDVGVLDQRITNLEYYQQLSLLERTATQMTVTDQFGLDRFKNGIFVDPFSDFTCSDVTNQEYSIAIDTKLGIARPKIQREVFRMKFNPSVSPNVQQTGRAVTLPYDEIPFITQPYATKYWACAPVCYAWNGKCILFPSYDNYNDIINTGSINVTIDNTTAWKDFAASPFGQLWGDWQTTSSSVSTSAITGTQDIRNVYQDVYIPNTITVASQTPQLYITPPQYAWDYTQSDQWNTSQILATWGSNMAAYATTSQGMFFYM